MATITPIDESQITLSREREPSERTLRTQAIEEDAKSLLAAISDTGAAQIKYEDDPNPDNYLTGLRAALQRMDRSDILLQKRRNSLEIVAWEARPEDQARIAKRRETGLRLGMIARNRSAKNKRSTHRPTKHRRAS